MPTAHKDTQEIAYVNCFICFLGCQVWGVPGPSHQQSPADPRPAWGPRHGAFRQGTQGVSLGVAERPPQGCRGWSLLWGQDTGSPPGSRVLPGERFRARQKPEMWRGPWKHARYPQDPDGSPVASSRALQAESPIPAFPGASSKRAGPRSPWPRSHPVKGLGEPHPGSREPGSGGVSLSCPCLPSLCCTCAAGAGTSVDLWAAEGKAWVRRGRETDFKSENSSGWTGAPGGLGALTLMRTAHSDLENGASEWHSSRGDSQDVGWPRGSRPLTHFFFLWK